ncbi:unnamed protein product, partial [Prorocentrum cordatum]
MLRQRATARTAGPAPTSSTRSPPAPSAACNADPDCTALHDNDCTDTDVRYCYSAISDIVANSEGTDSGACTYIKYQVTTSTRTTKTSSTESSSTISSMTDTSTLSGTATSSATLTFTISSFSVTVTTSSSSASSTTTISAATSIATTFSGAASTTLTSVSTDALYIDGPRVASAAWSGLCYSQPSSRADAEAACNADPDCTALHDTDCTNTGVRYCYSAISDIVVNWNGTNSRACT